MSKKRTEAEDGYPQSLDDVWEQLGFVVYQDKDTMLFVAQHPTYPVSSCAETAEEAVVNAREAVQLCEEPEGERTPDYSV